MNEEEKFKALIEKVKAQKEKHEFDLSLEEDLSVAVMNLVSLEEHFFFTAQKTGKEEYFDLLKETREIRKALLARMIDVHEGEAWCIAKHLLAAAMRLIEVGTKFQSDGNTQEAKDMFAKAYRVYALFWAVRLKLLDLKGVKKIGEGNLNVHDKSAATKPWTVEDIVNKLVDCCDE